MNTNQLKDEIRNIFSEILRADIPDDSHNLSIADTAAQTLETLLDCREHSSYIGTDISRSSVKG